jgi:hypothetical protein
LLTVVSANASTTQGPEEWTRRAPSGRFGLMIGEYAD